MAPNLEVRARKFRAIFDRAKATYLKKNQCDNQVNRPSFWGWLPVEIQINIFSHCRLQDIVHLRLASRAFTTLIDTHEEAISRKYLRLRRHGSLPSPIDESRTYTREPEDDVILLSDLFPPPRRENSDQGVYTFRYLWSLRKRQEVCSKLSYYLADRVLDRYMQTSPENEPPFASKKDLQASHECRVAQLQFKLTPLMCVNIYLLLDATPISIDQIMIISILTITPRFYTLFFLETYARARLDLQSDLYATYLAGRLPVPIQPPDRSRMFRKLQAEIVRTPPFTNTRTLISTHHCTHLLVSYLRFTLSPEPPFHTSCDPWISMLLTTSGLGRIAEFFAAEKGGGNNQRTMRKEFMRNMQADWDASRNDVRACMVYGDGEESVKPPPIREIWFEAARTEMRVRGVLPHQTEDWVEVSGGARISIGCQNCVSEDGWLA
ncbi:F-box domain-containing protein [Paracoccidioides lutzii Pb01]|uniref:F-box domain-containing protein n=1 Tax=Paracoccidioides lutzii (strain ATCC MYA-826 / Pb01) TaxID=502779 RepID=C1H2E1_PARBA|nr:F-box domain-containing protein [Paracoccidioides lutzii Pb01]EEH33721.2 F-box domain-containing protein [Paracoccidioides lutzii Pb01]